MFFTICFKRDLCGGKIKYYILDFLMQIEAMGPYVCMIKEVHEYIREWSDLFVDGVIQYLHGKIK
jgi:hypothetical protein